LKHEISAWITVIYRCNCFLFNIFRVLWFYNSVLGSYQVETFCMNSLYSYFKWIVFRYCLFSFLFNLLSFLKGWLWSDFILKIVFINFIFLNINTETLALLTSRLIKFILLFFWNFIFTWTIWVLRWNIIIKVISFFNFSLLKKCCFLLKFLRLN